MENTYGVVPQLTNAASVTATDVYISVFKTDNTFMSSRKLQADEYIYSPGNTGIDINLNLHMSRYTSNELPADNYNIYISFEKDGNPDVFIKEISPSKTEIRVGLDSEENTTWDFWLNYPDNFLAAFDKFVTIDGEHFRIINMTPDYSQVAKLQPGIEKQIADVEQTIANYETELQNGALPPDIMNELQSSIDQNQRRLNRLQVELNNIMQFATMIIKLNRPYSGKAKFPVKNSRIYTEQFVAVEYENVYVYFEKNEDNALIDITDRATREDSAGTTNWYNYEELVQNDSGSFLQNISASYVDGIKDLNIDFSSFENHTYFGLAEDKFINAYKKIRDIEVYNEIIQAFPTSSDSLTTSQSYSDKIVEIENGLTQYERYMYEKSESYAWPKYTSGTSSINYSYTSSQVQDWYAEQEASGSIFDKNNKYSLLKNMPEVIVLEDNEKYLRSLLGAWGDFFDYLKMYIEQFQYLFTFDYDKINSVPDEILHLYSSIFNVELFEGYDDTSAASYLHGSNQVSGSTALQKITREKWIRLFSSMPYLNKIRGTKRSIDAILNIYGIPRSILTIREFGGSKTSGSDYIEEDVNTYALNFYGGESIEVQNTNYSQLSGSDFTIEMRYATTSSGDHTLFGNTGFDVSLEDNGDGDDYGSLVCTISGSKTIWNASGSDAVPYYNGDWFNIILQRSGSELYLKTKYFKEDQMFYDLVGSASLNATSQSYLDAGAYAGNVLFFGGKTTVGNYSGSMQEIRLWSASLSEAAITQHAYDFRSVAMRNPFDIDHYLVAHYKLNDNVTGSTANDYSYPPVIDVTLNGFTGNQYSNFTKSTKTNLNYFMTNKYSSNQINIGQMSQSQVENSDVVDILFTPIKAINDDIIGDFSMYDFNDAIGDPYDMYEEKYTDLEKWRNFYFKKLPNNYNFYAYMRFIRHFDQSIMKLVNTVVPVRTKVWSGILIEQPILERSKYRWEKSTVQTNHNSASFDVMSVVLPSESVSTPPTKSINIPEEIPPTGSYNTTAYGQINVDIAGSNNETNSFYGSVDSTTDGQYLTVFELLSRATYEGTQNTDATNYDGAVVQVSQSSGTIIRVK